MANVPPPPTYADPVDVNQQTNKGQFNPIWLSWFLLLSTYINQNGGTSGTAHNNLSGLQGGTSTERYHLSGAAATAVEANYATWLTSSSTISASKVQGRTDGATPATGYIGETLSGTGSGSQSFNTLTTLATLSLTAGSWEVYGHTYFPAQATALTNVACELTTGSSLDTAQVSQVGSKAVATGVNSNRLRLNLATTTTVNLLGQITGTSGGTATHSSTITAVRVA